MKKLFYPFLALALGVAGFLLRTQQLTAALDSDTGMLVLHHPLTYAVIGLTAGAVFILLILSLFVSNEAQDWYSAFHTETILPRLLSVLAVLGFCSGTALIFRMLLFDGLPGSLLTQPFLSFFGLLMIFASLAILVLLIRNGDNGSYALAALLPGFASCVWLVLTYHNNASNPSVLAFAWQLLAVISACFGWYYTAGFAFRHPHPRRTTFFSLLTATLCIICLADRTDLYQQILLVSNALWFLSRSMLLIDNTQYSGKHAR